MTPAWSRADLPRKYYVYRGTGYDETDPAPGRPPAPERCGRALRNGPCGRPAGHPGRCASETAYQTRLERNREND